MPSFTLTYGVYDEQTLTGGQTGIVGSNAVILADTDVGIFGSAGAAQALNVTVLGEVLASSTGGVTLSGGRQTVAVGQDAYVNANISAAYYSAIVLLDSEYGSSVFNEGSISGRSSGVYFDGVDAAVSNTVTNHGSITGNFYGVNFAGSGSAFLFNSGSVSSTSRAIYGSRTVTNTLHVSNSGLIQSNVDAIYSTSTTTLRNTGDVEGAITFFGGADRIDNRAGSIFGAISMGAENDILDNRGGTITGDIDLGAGNDVFDNRGGVVVGEVLGLDGNDSFRPGAGDEVINGGSGTDTLDFRGTGAVQVALDGSIDFTGNADGDEYISIESLYGSSFADLLIGNASGNVIKGFAGADTISGGAGVDKILGGSGIDVLTGGAGNDQFIFGRVSDSGDLITDFGTSVGNDDLIRIDAGAFGGGLVAGALAATRFQSRADNVAQDADDRFIFRTSDRSLWFDIDGNGAEGPVMIADLQAGVMLTAADISLF